jgi:quinoprotein glucose dehydrogenase
MPGNNGGSNFGSAAIDPEHGTVIVVSKDWPALLKLSAPEGASPANGDGGIVRYESPFGFMITSSGLTAIAPPWTSMTAYDLNAGTIKWKIPLGEVPELAAKGIADTGSHFPKVGPVVTAGGLIFAGTRDKKIRAFDIDTGKVLWKVEVDAGVEGIPSVYEVNGKQYIVYCAAAPATSHTHPPMYSPAARGESGDTPAPTGRGGRGGGGNIPGAYVAFALPEGVK